MIESILSQTVQYVIQAPSFWSAMGFTTATGMMIGALMYDGNLDQVSKGIVSVLSYAALLVWLITARVAESITTSLQPERSLAGIVSIVFTTVAWLVGVFLGVTVINLKHRSMNVL